MLLMCPWIQVRSPKEAEDPFVSAVKVTREVRKGEA
jgi:hypothetical protein